MAFDLRVQTTDAKTGKMSDHEQAHYVLHISEGSRRYERPIGSGHFYDESGALIQKPAAAAKEAAQPAAKAK